MFNYTHASAECMDHKLLAQAVVKLVIKLIIVTSRFRFDIITSFFL